MYNSCLHFEGEVAPFTYIIIVTRWQYNYNTRPNVTCCHCWDLTSAGHGLWKLSCCIFEIRYGALWVLSVLLHTHYHGETVLFLKHKIIALKRFRKMNIWTYLSKVRTTWLDKRQHFKKCMLAFFLRAKSNFFTWEDQDAVPILASTSKFLHWVQYYSVYQWVTQHLEFSQYMECQWPNSLAKIST